MFNKIIYCSNKIITIRNIITTFGNDFYYSDTEPKVIHDNNGKIIAFNNAFADIHGYLPTELINMKIIKIGYSEQKKQNFIHTNNRKGEMIVFEIIDEFIKKYKGNSYSGISLRYLPDLIYKPEPTFTINKISKGDIKIFIERKKKKSSN